MKISPLFCTTTYGLGARLAYLYLRCVIEAQYLFRRQRSDRAEGSFIGFVEYFHRLFQIYIQTNHSFPITATEFVALSLATLVNNGRLFPPFCESSQLAKEEERLVTILSI